MATFDSLLSQSAWCDASFSDQESQRLFSADLFAVDVVFASVDGMMSLLYFNWKSKKNPSDG